MPPPKETRRNRSRVVPLGAEAADQGRKAAGAGVGPGVGGGRLQPVLVPLGDERPQEGLRRGPSHHRNCALLYHRAPFRRSRPVSAGSARRGHFGAPGSVGGMVRMQGRALLATAGPRPHSCRGAAEAQAILSDLNLSEPPFAVHPLYSGVWASRQDDPRCKDLARRTNQTWGLTPEERMPSASAAEPAE